MENKENFSITIMCEVLKVDRSSYYYWIKEGCTLDKVDFEFNELVKKAFKQSRQTYGVRRMKKALADDYGVIASMKRIGEIMKSLNLVVKMKQKFKVNTTDSNHNSPIAENVLDRNFTVSAANNVYVGDITYIHTQEGWLYLATVIDLFSRKIVGWSMSEHMKVSLVNDALLMALNTRKPSKGLIWHTDRGSQYASTDHRALLAEHGIIQSMSRKGNCWDNAVAESFFHSLKTELVYHENYETRAQANQSIFEYIEVFYNRMRLHSSNNYMSPVKFENKMLLNEKVI
jgi:transposase InsO family protein